MFERVKFENYLSLADLELRLSRLTVLVGANASGKSNVLRGLYRLGQFANAPPGKVFQDALPPRLILSHGAPESRISLACYSDVGLVRLDMEGPPPSDSNGQSSNERHWTERLHVEPASQGKDGYFTADDETRVRRSIAAKMLRLNAASLAKPSYSSATIPRMSATGAGLAPAIEWLKLQHGDRFEALQTALRDIVPEFREIKFRRVAVLRRESEIVRFGEEAVERTMKRKFQGSGLSLRFANGAEVEASLCSDGTLIALGLLTTLHSPASPGVILIDDIEQGLHPSAQRRLIEIVRRILEMHPSLQIVATSHSPNLADCLTVDELRIVAMNDRGETSCGQLHEHAKFEKWKDEMAPGELWSLFGERWLVEGQVAEA